VRSGQIAAQAIVEGHGGRVALDSTPGHGTCVRLLLPVRPPAALEPLPAQEARA
jgi:signal transduction histidine kinase